MARRQALVRQTVYRLGHRVQVWRARHGAVAVSGVLISTILGSAFFIPTLQERFGDYFGNPARLGALQSLLLAVGAALIGAAAIVSALVMFAMQVNVERMPHGLFRRLSADVRLLSTFAATFLLAIGIAVLSLLSDPYSTAIAVSAAAWATVIILALFLYGYKRALLLINPAQQLWLVVSAARRELNVWSRRAECSAPLFPPQDGYPRRAREPQHDLVRLTYFQAYPQWTARAIQALRYAISLAQRYAERGDYEVSSIAFNAVTTINIDYVKAKGRTFFAHELLLENPLTSDAFILDTLEHLRRQARIATARGDEQYLDQALRAVSALVRVYAQIDYVTEGAEKTHAHLAVAYLYGAVENTVPHNMADVLMEGVRLMGNSAGVLLRAEGPRAMSTIIDRIGGISCAGAAREDYRPVAVTGVEQLARLSYDLLRARHHFDNVRFAARDIRRNVNLIARLFLALPDTVLLNVTRNVLSAYYSLTDQGLIGRLTELVNALARAVAADAAVREIAHNICEWSDGLHDQRELLLEAIARRSSFAFDLLSWIRHLTSILLAVSNVPACDGHVRDELRRHARTVVSLLSFIPDDAETVHFVETYRLTDTLFEVAVDARNRGCEEVSQSVAERLLVWGFNAGRHRTGWSVLERGLSGLAVLALWQENGAATLIDKVHRRLAQGNLPDEELLDRAARNLRGRADALAQIRYPHFTIEHLMAEADHERLQPLLQQIADLISPGTAGEAVEPAFF